MKHLERKRGSEKYTTCECKLNKIKIMNETPLSPRFSDQGMLLSHRAGACVRMCGRDHWWVSGEAHFPVTFVSRDVLGSPESLIDE